MKKLDYRQFQCPHPVVETRKELLANPELTFEIRVGDQIACDNIARLAANLGYSCSEQASEDGYVLTLTPGNEAVVVAPMPNSGSGKTVVLCSSDQLGSGDPELGQILLKNFLITLTEVDSPPELLLLVNSGVKLACSGSESVEALEKLACQGVDIASCGLCLDFYNLKEQLQVGRVTNMLEIAESQLQAARIITP